MCSSCHKTSNDISSASIGLLMIEIWLFKVLEIFWKIFSMIEREMDEREGEKEMERASEEESERKNGVCDVCVI